MSMRQTHNKRINERIRKYIVVLSGVFGGFVLKIFLSRTIHYPEGGFLISLATVIFSAWYGGLETGLLALFINYFIIDWFFITPRRLFFEDTLNEKVRFIFFIGEGVIISWFFEILHRTNAKLRKTLQIVSSSEKRFKVLVENIADHVIFTVDDKGLIKNWSDTFEKIVGYQTDEVFYKSFSLLFPQNAKRRVLKSLDRAILRGSHHWEGWIARKDGSLFGEKPL